METKFELEIKYDKQKMKRVLLILGTLITLSIIAYILGNVFWETHTYLSYTTTLKGQKQVVEGWPVWFCMIGKYLGVISVISFLILFSKSSKDEPILALNSDGLYINQNGIKDTFVKWVDINRVEKKEVNSEHIALSFYFVDSSKIIESVKGIQKTFVKENLKDGKPLTIENNLVVGDFNAFYNKAKSYISVSN